MIQTQILTPAPSAQAQKEPHQGFQVHKARTDNSENPQQSAQAFRAPSGFNNQRNQSTQKSHTGKNIIPEITQTENTGQKPSGIVDTLSATAQTAAGWDANTATIQADMHSREKLQHDTDTPEISGIHAVLTEIADIRRQLSTQVADNPENRQTAGNNPRNSTVSALAEPGFSYEPEISKVVQISGKTAPASLTETQPGSRLFTDSNHATLKSVQLSATDTQMALSTSGNASLQTQLSLQQASSPTHQQTTNGAEWAAVRVDPQSGKWGEQMLSILHDRVTVQAQQHLQEARIRLDPPELGKLDLLVRVDGDRLHVQIHANTTATRDALVQVSDRLRAELQDQNFVHVDVNIGSEQQGQDGHQTLPGHEDEPTIFVSRNQQDPDDNHTPVTSEHWLNTQA